MQIEKRQHPRGSMVETIADMAYSRMRATERRALVVEIALTWLGTPYHDHARVKGAGVDCAMFPLAVYREAGVIRQEIALPDYSPQWHLHHEEEKYLAVVKELAREVDRAQPGDFVIYKFGRCWSHGGIVVDWPAIIHATLWRGVVLADGEREGELVGRKRRFFSPF